MELNVRVMCTADFFRNKLTYLSGCRKIKSYVESVFIYQHCHIFIHKPVIIHIAIESDRAEF